MSDFAWSPSSDFLENSNVTRLMRKAGAVDLADLVRRSVADVGSFWALVEKDLGIEWSRPYQRVLDSSRGIPWTKWFVGGRVNLAANCVDRHAASGRRNKLALVWEGEDGKVVRWTYRDLARETARLAGALAALGVRKGDAVGLFLPIGPEGAAATYACAKLGAVYIPIFSGFGAPAVAARLADVGARVLVTQDAFLRRGKWIEMKAVADEAATLSGTVERLVCVRRAGTPVPWKEGRDLWYHEACASQPPARPCAETESEDPFLVIHTSGTTGRPKGAVHVHGGFLVKIAAEAAYQCDLREADTLFWFTDLGWIMGPWELVGGHALGATVFCLEGAPDYPAPDRLWEVIERHGISALGISPTAIRALMKYGEQPVHKHDLSSLRVLGSTGEPWNPEAWRWYFEHVGGGRCPIINLSGGTEVGACFLSPHPVQPLKVCTLGGPALGMDIEVYDDAARPVRGAVGELVCRQPWPGMTRGMWKDPDRYLETYWSRWKDTWVHGDWASIDAEGYWYLHGRSDDTIKVAGKRVGPAEVESALSGNAAVLESAAIGVPDELKGETLVAFVVLRPGHEESEALREALGARVVEVLGKAMRPKAVKFVRQLPKTRNAKILRRLVRAVYVGKTDLGDTSNLENPDALAEIGKAR